MGTDSPKEYHMAIKIRVNESTNNGLVKALSDGLPRLVGMLQDEYPFYYRSNDKKEYGIAISGGDVKVAPAKYAGHYDLSKEKVTAVSSDIYARNKGTIVMDGDVAYWVNFDVNEDGNEFYAKVKVFPNNGEEDILGLDRIRFGADDVDYALRVIRDRIVKDLDERIPDNSILRDYNGRTK